MIRRITLFVTILLMLLGTPLLGRSNNMLFSDKELSSNLINDIFLDRDGMLWIATENGLNRFDGSKITMYFHDDTNPHSVAHDFVRYVYQDSKGNLFVGSYIGLQLYRPETDDFTVVGTYEDGRELYSSPSYMTEATSGRIFTSGQVMNEVFVRDGLPYFWDLEYSKVQGMTGRLQEDRYQRLWCRNSVGNFYCIRKDGEVETPNVGLPVTLTEVFSDSEKNIYLLTDTQDLLRFDENKSRWAKINNGPISASTIRCVYRLDANHLLVGTDGNGIKSINERTGEVSDFLVELPAMDSRFLKVHEICSTKDGDLILALFLKGVAIVPMSQSSFDYLGSLSSASDVVGSSNISALLCDRQGEMWVGTDGEGVYRLDADLKMSHHYHSSSLGKEFPSIVQELYQDSDGRVWVGTHGEGCGYIDPRSNRFNDCTHLFTRDGSVSSKVYGFIEDRSRRLWVATMGCGLFCYDLNRHRVVEELSFDKGINLWETTLLITSSNHLLIGTYDGVYTLDLNEPTLQPRHLFDRHIIFSLYEDADGQLWAAGSSGVVRFNMAGALLQEMTQKDGLSGNVAYSLQGDSARNLWIGTNRGLSCFNPIDSTFSNYQDGDGLQGSQFSKNVSCRDALGRLWFGGAYGINYFYPSQVHTQSSDLQVRLTGFYVNNRPINAGTLSGDRPIIDRPVYEAEQFSLLHEDNAFSIELSTLGFDEPGRVRFLYSMNDGPWYQLPAGGRLVSFGALRPGTYHFRYKAQRNMDESPVKEIDIEIRPYWWESVPALVFYLLFILFLISAFFVQMRHRYLAHRAMLIEKHAHEIDEAKLRFFTNITHEIRTPMTLIMSPLQKLMDTDMDTARQQAYQTMKRNANMLLQLVNQLLDIRKIDNNQMRLHFQETEVIRLLQEQVDFFNQMADNKHIQLTFQHKGIESLKLWVDPGYFNKIVINLLSNAIKYTPNEGEVTLTISSDPLRSDGAGYVRISVSDNGIGISPEDREHIFERFYRAHNAYQSADGNGIGLHLTRSLVTLHHGTIQILDNEGGQGTTFLVRLPMGNQHLSSEEMVQDEVQKIVDSKVVVKHVPPESLSEPKENVSAKTAAPRTKYRLLVVDDDSEIRSYLRRELEADFIVSECQNGEEAMKEIFCVKPDLIISDIMMPLVDGLTLCQRIKQNIDLNHIPVVLLTAKADQESNIAGLECGADAYITKPFYIEILRSTAMNLIKTRSKLRNNFNGRQDQTERLEQLNLPSADEKLLERIMQSVNRNIGNAEFTVEDLGADVGLSRVHVYRKLKELTNQSPHEFLRNMRLKEAARLLLKEDSYTVNEIAYAVGFLRPNNFSSAFKEQFGYPPMQWKALQKKAAAESSEAQDIE